MNHAPARLRRRPVLPVVAGAALVLGAAASAVPAAASPVPGNNAQIVSGNTFLASAYAEVGSRPNGSFASDIDAPAGFHPHNEYDSKIGFVADREKDGWGVGTDDGDFFAPGDPYEGWALQVGSGGTAWNSNYGSGVPGAWSDATVTTAAAGATWTATAPYDGVQVTQVATMPTGAQYVNVDVTVTNTTGAPLTDVRYARALDADNCRTRSTAVCDSDGDGVANTTGVYSTQNTIIHQRSAGDADSRVSSTQTDGSYVDLRSTAEGSTAVVGTQGDFCVNPLPLADLAVAASTTHNQWSPSCGLDTTKGASYFEDDLIYLVVNTPSLAAGASRTFRVRYVLTESAGSEDLDPPTVPEPQPQPQPQPKPQPQSPTKPKPTSAHVAVAPAGVVKGGSSVPVGCATAGAKLASCTVTMSAQVGGERVVLGRASRSYRGRSVRSDQLTVRLSPTARKLVQRLGGLRVQVQATVRAAGSSKKASVTRSVQLLPRSVRLRPVYFDIESHRVGAPARRYLAQVRGQLARVRSITIVGYTDGQDSVGHNRRLGLRRAEAVRAALGARPGIRVTVVSRGERQPAASNGTRQGRAENRRAVIVVRY